jgi:hypothetical protein
MPGEAVAAQAVNATFDDEPVAVGERVRAAGASRAIGSGIIEID